MGNIRHMMVGVIGTMLAVSHAFGGERELDAHQHGHGVVNIAIEDQTLWIELEAPGADIVVSNAQRVPKKTKWRSRPLRLSSAIYSVYLASRLTRHVSSTK